MKKFIVGLFISMVALLGFSVALDIDVTELSSMASCNQNETDNVNYYLTENGFSRNPSDTFWNNVDSLIGGSNNGSSINIWRHGVISNCNTWNRVSNVVDGDDSNGALIFLNTDNCVFNIPNYTKTSNPTGVDAQIHYTIGYRLIYDGGANTLNSRLYYRDYGINNRTCYPAGNSVQNSNSCPTVTVKYGSQKYHTGECLNYRVFWCGDGLKNSPYGTTYRNGSFVEECDPNLPSSIPSGKTCTNTCTLVDLEQPQCNTTYSGQTHYTNLDPTRWLTQNTPNLCTIGTLVPGTFNSTWSTGGSRHFYWNCTNGSTIQCEAKQQWCGDGKVETNHGEACDFNDPYHVGWNNNGYTCNSSCQLVAEPPLCNSQYSGYHYINNPVYPNWLNASTPGLCSVGTLKPNSFTNRWQGSGHAGHYRWRCRNSAGQETMCEAIQYRCGDGIRSNGEACDFRDETHSGWNNNGYTCNSSCELVTPPAQPNLTIDKEQISSGTMEAGSLVVYKITVRNIGSGTATGVRIYDALPHQLQYMASSISIVPTSSYHFTTGIVTIGGHQRTYILYTGITLTANGTATVYLTGKVKNGFTINTLTNCATVSGTNIPQQEDCVEVTPPTPPTQPHVTIVKEQISTGTMEAGSLVVYKITATNIGSGIATGVRIYDELPRHLQYLTSSIILPPHSQSYFTMGSTGTNNTTYILYTGITLGANGGTAVVYLTGKVKQGHSFITLTNCATVGGSNIPETGNCVTWTEEPEPHVTVVKEQISTGTMEAGSLVVYKITATNTGSGIATGVRIYDELPRHLQYLTSSIILPPHSQSYFTMGSTGTNNTTYILYTGITLGANGGTAVVYLTGKVKQGHSFITLTNCATVGGSNIPETGNCVTWTEDEEPEPYFLKEQRVGDTSFTTEDIVVHVGDIIQYKLTFGNIGSAPATGEIRDYLPQCLLYQTSSIVGVDVYNSSFPTMLMSNKPVKYYNFTLQPGQTGHVIISAMVQGDGACSNITKYLNTGYFTLGGITLSGDVLAIREESNTTTVGIKKEVSPTSVRVGDVVTYTITYRNNGPEVLQNYTIVDTWPSDKLEFSGVVSADPSYSSFTQDGNRYQRQFNNQLDVNETGQIIIQGIVL